RDARPPRRPPHDPQRGRGLLALRAAAALGAGPAGRPRAGYAPPRPVRPAPRGRDSRQLAGEDLGLPDHGRNLLRHGLRRLGPHAHFARRPRPGDRPPRPLPPHRNPRSPRFTRPPPLTSSLRGAISPLTTKSAVARVVSG